MQEIVIGWFVIPSAVASIASAIWTYLSTRDLKRVESRLRREEEAFRVVQSPRVQAAVELWSAFVVFEAAIEKSLDPYFLDPYKTIEQLALPASDDSKVPEREDLEREAENEARSAKTLLVAATARAELLIAPDLYGTLVEAISALDAAHDERASARPQEATSHLESGSREPWSTSPAPRNSAKPH